MDEEIKKLLEKNLAMTEEIYKMTKSIKSFVVWERVFGVIKLLLIAVPIILGIIYLPPLLNNVIGQYQSLLGGANGAGAPTGNIMDLLNSLKSGSGALDMKNFDIDKLPPEMRKLIK